MNFFNNEINIEIVTQIISTLLKIELANNNKNENILFFNIIKIILDNFSMNCLKNKEIFENLSEILSDLSSILILDDFENFIENHFDIIIGIFNLLEETNNESFNDKILENIENFCSNLFLNNQEVI